MNEAVRADLPVRKDFISLREAAEKFDLGRLPEGTGDRLRIIVIGDYDACPCIGPHVATTGQIGEFHIASVGFANDVVRIRYKLQG